MIFNININIDTDTEIEVTQRKAKASLCCIPGIQFYLIQKYIKIFFSFKSNSEWEL